MNQPVLSICIPTYNRAEYLEKALKAYTSNVAFDDEIEIVISDNASTDNTEKLCRYYASRYANIKYFRNEVNLNDSNFSLALERASGLYVKLMNDNLIILDDGLEYLKRIIKNNLEERIPFFFTNGALFNHNQAEEVSCDNFEEFVVRVSYVVTAIMVFGAWKDDWDQVRNRSRYTKTIIAVTT